MRAEDGPEDRRVRTCWECWAYAGWLARARGTEAKA